MLKTLKVLIKLHVGNALYNNIITIFMDLSIIMFTIIIYVLLVRTNATNNKK